MGQIAAFFKVPNLEGLQVVFRDLEPPNMEHISSNIETHVWKLEITRMIRTPQLSENTDDWQTRLKSRVNKARKQLIDHYSQA